MRVICEQPAPLRPAVELLPLDVDIQAGTGLCAIQVVVERHAVRVAGRQRDLGADQIGRTVGAIHVDIVTRWRRKGDSGH